MNTLRLDHVFSLLRRAVAHAMTEHPTPYRSAHEALGIVTEEHREFEAEVFRKQFDPGALEKEALHLATVALRTVLDVTQPVTQPEVPYGDGESWAREEAVVDMHTRIKVLRHELTQARKDARAAKYALKITRREAARDHDLLNGVVDAILNRQDVLRVPRCTERHPAGMDVAQAVAQGFDDLIAEIRHLQDVTTDLSKQQVEDTDKLFRLTTRLEQQQTEAECIAEGLRLRIADLQQDTRDLFPAQFAQTKHYRDTLQAVADMNANVAQAFSEHFGTYLQTNGENAPGTFDPVETLRRIAFDIDQNRQFIVRLERDLNDPRDGLRPLLRRLHARTGKPSTDDFGKMATDIDAIFDDARRGAKLGADALDAQVKLNAANDMNQSLTGLIRGHFPHLGAYGTGDALRQGVHELKRAAQDGERAAAQRDALQEEFDRIRARAAEDFPNWRDKAVGWIVCELLKMRAHDCATFDDVKKQLDIEVQTIIDASTALDGAGIARNIAGKSTTFVERVRFTARLAQSRGEDLSRVNRLLSEVAGRAGREIPGIAMLSFEDRLHRMIDMIDAGALIPRHTLRAVIDEFEVEALSRLPRRAQQLRELAARLREFLPAREAQEAPSNSPTHTTPQEGAPKPADGQPEACAPVMPCANRGEL